MNGASEARRQNERSRRDTALEKLLRPAALRVFTAVYGNLFTPARPRVVLACSAGKGEGASTVATGLALAAAEKGAEGVLLIDGNLHSPKISETFGVAGGSGLGDLLRGSMETTATVIETGMSGLSVMGAGVIRGDHLRALERPKFRNLLEKLERPYGFIVVDGPAINAYPESVLYACQVDRVLLIVHAGATRGPEVAMALSKITAGGCDAVEIVLNRRPFAIPTSVYKKL